MIKTQWYHPLVIQDTIRPSKLWPYLLEQQSLTQRIRQSYPNLYVQRLSQYYGNVSQQDAAVLQLTPRQRIMIREVYLRTNDNIGTYGHSIIPCSALKQNALPWLKTLGEQSLGDVLNRQSQWQRKNLQVSLLTAENIEYQQATQHYATTATHLWARQSQLIIQNHAILITEVFFPEFFDENV